MDELRRYTILNPGKFLASAVGSLTQPLFNKGQVVAQYRIARAQQEEAALGFQQTLLNAGSEVNDALTAYQTSQGKGCCWTSRSLPCKRPCEVLPC